MIESLRELARYRELLYVIAWRDIKIKYKQSLLGFMWAILMPGIVVIAGLLVRVAMSKLSGEPLESRGVASVCVKAVPWAFFIASIRFSTTSLIGNANLVTKIYFPKVILPLASVLSQLFDFVVAALAIAVALIVLGVGVSAQLLWVPLLIVNLVLLSMGLGVMLSAASLFFRDVKYIVDVIVTFAIFFTPVLYEVSMFGKWATLLLLNPVAPIMEGLHASVVEQVAPSIPWICYSLVFATSFLIASFAFFRKLEPAFAENI
jgi:ABC-type polysaccharide/polyol phosphate export permease